MAALGSEELPDAVGQQLQALYSPFRTEDFGFVSTEGDDLMRKSSLGERGSGQPIDPIYLQTVLTAEQDDELLAFLRKPEGEDSAPPGGGNA